MIVLTFFLFFRHTLLTPPDQDPMWFCVNIALLFVIWAVVMLWQVLEPNSSLVLYILCIIRSSPIQKCNKLTINLFS